MPASCPRILKQAVIAATLVLAAVASWALTDFAAPAVEASTPQHR